MKKKKRLCFWQCDYFNPILLPLGDEPFYDGELLGLSHEEARNLYEKRLKEGFYDEGSD